MKIAVEQAGHRFLVEADSGNQYHITYAGSGDGDPEYVGLWQCDCPAGQHGRECKHLRAFLASRLADYGDPEYDGEDIPESIEV